MSTRSSRWLAGTRRNKRQPIARHTRPSDRAANSPARHYLAGGWIGTGWRHTSGAYCACGLTYDGFASHREAIDLIDAHIAGCSRPDHAVRAVSIDACFGTMRLPERGNPGAHAGECGRSALPLTVDQRAQIYYAQGPGGTFQNGFTRRQARRYWKKARAAGEAA